MHTTRPPVDLGSTQMKRQHPTNCINWHIINFRL